MQFQVFSPSPSLSPYVKHYWSLETRFSGKDYHIQRIVPCGLFELVFYMKDKPLVMHPAKMVSDNLMVSGQQKGFHDLKVTGHMSLFAIYFHPLSLGMFLNVPLGELFDHGVPLRYLLKGDINQLEDQLAMANGALSRVRIVEAFLMKRLRKIQNGYQFHRITHAIQQINKKRDCSP